MNAEFSETADFPATIAYLAVFTGLLAGAALMIAWGNRKKIADYEKADKENS